MLHVSLLLPYSILFASFTIPETTRLFPLTRTYMKAVLPAYDDDEDSGYRTIVSHDHSVGYCFFFYRRRTIRGILWSPRCDKTQTFSALKNWYTNGRDDVPKLSARLKHLDDKLAWHFTSGAEGKRA